MDENQRRFIRIETSDLIEIRPADGIGTARKAVVKDFSMLGICFYCPIQWCYGQALEINYSVPGTGIDVALRARVMWSELIDENRGYLIGTSIMYIEDYGIDAFLRHYYTEVNKLSSSS